MHDCECPYCGADVEINHDDHYGYCEDETYQQDCGECGKTFVYTTSISYSYDTAKADCLNGMPHDWKPTKTWPKCATSMRCSMCDESRPPTDEEKQKHGIPSYVEYFKELEKARPTTDGKGEL